MAQPDLRDAFAHHVWATLELADVCLALSPEQLDTSVPGTYGSIIDTWRHLVGADSSYLHVTSGERIPDIHEDDMDLSALREEMATHADGWKQVLASDVSPDTVLVRHRPDGSETHAPLSIRLAQVLHHGTDHRSQICTALTSLGIEPPAIDVWDFADHEGRLVEVPPSS